MITCTILATKNERSVLESMQLYWIYCSVCASSLEILLKVYKLTGYIARLSSISSKFAQTEQYIQ